MARSTATATAVAAVTPAVPRTGRSAWTTCAACVSPGTCSQLAGAARHELLLQRGLPVCGLSSGEGRYESRVEGTKAESGGLGR